MATNEVYKYGDWIELPVPDGTVAGDAVVVGQLTGVAQTDRDADGNASVALIGAYDVPVAGAVAAVGTPVYIGSSGATATATGNQLLGHALATKGTGTGVIPVRLTGFSPGAGV
ncbi:MAG: DUF2190 family protein [Streptosporangiales bacterium]|nr:DUF2190 family protein [Streptosporangiales bacterium]